MGFSLQPLGTSWEPGLQAGFTLSVHRLPPSGLMWIHRRCQKAGAFGRASVANPGVLRVVNHRLFWFYGAAFPQIVSLPCTARGYFTCWERTTGYVNREPFGSTPVNCGFTQFNCAKPGGAEGLGPLRPGPGPGPGPAWGSPRAAQAQLPLGFPALATSLKKEQAPLWKNCGRFWGKK